MQQQGMITPFKPAPGNPKAAVVAMNCHAALLL